MTKRESGRLGGLATLAKHGKEHFRAIGRLGSAEQQRRYKLQPAGLNGWALICRQSGRVVALWS